MPHSRVCENSQTQVNAHGFKKRSSLGMAPGMEIWFALWKKHVCNGGLHVYLGCKKCSCSRPSASLVSSCALALSQSHPWGCFCMKRRRLWRVPRAFQRDACLSRNSPVELELDCGHLFFRSGVSLALLSVMHKSFVCWEDFCWLNF